MKLCQYASYCKRRMRDGDQANGCSTVDQKTCSPSIEPVSRPPPVRMLNAYCRKCGASVAETGWRIARALSPTCKCGSRDIAYDEAA